MGENVLVPGGRDVRGTLDAADDATACVVACPPHPQQGGSRSDRRLRAVSDALTGSGIDCLRFDYGDWDEGYGERADAGDAARWAADRYDRIGGFGYSFGGAIAALAAADLAGTDAAFDALSVLAPAARLAADLDAAAALDAVAAPVQVVYGARDDTVDWRPLVERARERGFSVVELPADHFLVGQHDAVAPFLADALGR